MLSEFYNQFKQYFFHSDDRKIAWLLLIGVLLGVALSTVMTVAFVWCGNMFFAAILAKNLISMFQLLGVFTGLILASIGINIVTEFIKETLCIRWRKWLSEKLNTQYHKNKNYLRLKRTFGDIDNPTQRIQDDVKKMVDKSLNLVLEFFSSILNLGTFIVTLWVVGGAIAFTIFGLNIVIPGYLVWVSLIFAVISSVGMNFIGNKLNELKTKIAELEADFRMDNIRMTAYAENVALEKGEKYFFNTFTDGLKRIIANAYNINWENAKISSFQNLCSALPHIIPSLCSAPLYFAGKITISQFSLIGMAFGQVTSALSWFVNSFAAIAECKVHLSRVAELQKALNDTHFEEHARIQRESNSLDKIIISNLTVRHPLEPNKSFISHINLTLERYQHVLIKGVSGLGKSTFYKVLAATWNYGEGLISIPFKNDADTYYLPQNPLIPRDTLRAVLAYPETVDKYTAQEYHDVLNKINNISRFIPQLDDKQDWGTILSGGQQQSISFARALLKKPKWLFLDEATAALDSAGERRLYELLKTELPFTTLISIAHKETVEQYHDRVITLSDNGVTEDRKAHATLVLGSTVQAPVSFRAKNPKVKLSRPRSNSCPAILH